MVVEFPALPIFYDGQANPAAIGTGLRKFRSQRVLLRRLEDDPDIAGVGEFTLDVTLDSSLADSSASIGAMVMFSAMVSTLFLM
jgi:L-alanine-DL-glutamate epimerase-like enolase superfamily enzyme